MNNTSTTYNISNAENGWIVNRAKDIETQKDDAWATSFTSETYVFSKWEDMISWMQKDNEAEAS